MSISISLSLSISISLPLLHLLLQLLHTSPTPPPPSPPQWPTSGRLFFCFCSQSESSRDITSQPGYGRSPKKLMCIGHFSACASGRLHVHAARLLFFMSCGGRCSRAAACFLQPLHTMLCVLSFFLLDKSAGGVCCTPKEFVARSSARI